MTHLYYDDGNSASIGESDYALITDLKVGQDFIQLYGSANLYSLDFYTTDSGIKADLIYDSGVAARGEIIGILENVSPTLKVTDFFLPDQKLADPSFIGSGDYGTLYDGIFGSVFTNVTYQGGLVPIFVNNSPPNIINGTDGDDILIGTDGDDIIHGFGGNDLISGLSGNDTLFGDEGNDTIDGGSGNDSIDGGIGNDSLTGGDGYDTIFGGGGDNTIDGGGGNDIINVADGDGNNNILGGEGDDTIDAGSGNDTIDGGIGNDTINGGDGNAVTTGESDYALITDFNSLEDTIQLHGPAQFYQLDFYTTSSGTINVALTYDPGVTDRRELIGIIQEVSPTLKLNDPAFIFV